VANWQEGLPMPWNETCTMTERMKFVALAELGEETMAALCRSFGISRKTGYKLLARYRAEGLNGLCDRSHAAIDHPHAVSEAIEERILALRADRPTWGPRKLRARLCMIDAATVWPAPSTIGELLRQRGLVIRRRRRMATPLDVSPFVNCVGPNDNWCIDFKGWFRTQDGRRCDPLTISDAYSRYLLRCQAVRRADTRHVRPLLEATFREYGLPLALRSDNGPPFASRGVAGLSRLSVWCVRLGIKPERIKPGRPSENGRHERMHGTLQREACQPPAESLRVQQQCFDTFRRIYNEERPHEAIANLTPGMIYRPSTRPYPARLPEMVYPEPWQVRKVRPNGEIKWQGEAVFIGQALAGELIGMAESDHGFWRLHFGSILLGTLDHAGNFHRAAERKRGRVALREPAASRDAPAH
jgi:transposase InsO family protein